ncbi:hypothetical protein B0H34DRAFT_341344 [Crassisporium funariophilum]|nr:hypothetical protein B0H34DRAFT_341344 [Crassisporium funariophilum]
MYPYDHISGDGQRVAFRDRQKSPCEDQESAKYSTVTPRCIHHHHRSASQPCQQLPIHAPSVKEAKYVSK